MFRPVRKLPVGVKSKPIPQLVASSGTNPLQLPSQPPPTRIGADPPEPPFIEMPGSCCALGIVAPGSTSGAAAGQADALPGGPSPPGPIELISFHAPDPTGGR